MLVVTNHPNLLHKYVVKENCYDIDAPYAKLVGLYVCRKSLKIWHSLHRRHKSSQPCTSN